jgi:myosin heavy subunit
LICVEQLLSGASAAERKKWQLKEMGNYHYIDQSTERTIPDVDDKALFAVLNASMLSVGITA